MQCFKVISVEYLLHQKKKKKPFSEVIANFLILLDGHLVLTNNFLKIKPKSGIFIKQILLSRLLLLILFVLC